jgi:hypothetical protein
MQGARKPWAIHAGMPCTLRFTARDEPPVHLFGRFSRDPGGDGVGPN